MSDSLTNTFSPKRNSAAIRFIQALVLTAGLALSGPFAPASSTNSALTLPKGAVAPLQAVTIPQDVNVRPLES